MGLGQKYHILGEYTPLVLRIVRIPLICGHTGLVLYLARTIVYVRHLGKVGMDWVW